MAGSGKGKRNKHQGKSNAHRSNPIIKPHGTSSSNINVGEKQSDNFDKSEEFGDRNVPPMMQKASDEKISLSKISIQMMLEGSIASMKRKSFTSAAPSLEGNVTSVANHQVNAPISIQGESSVDFDELDIVDLIKSLANCPNEMDLEDWLATCSENSRDYIILNLIEKVEYLTTQVRQSRDSAKMIIIQTTKRFNDNKIELRNMRLQNNERESLLKQKEELDCFISMLTEMENYLRMVNREIDHVNQAIKRLEGYDLEIQATKEVPKFCASEFKEALLLAQKMEREILKMSKDTEKQIGELKRHFTEERRKIAELEQKLKQFNEDHEHAKATPSYGC